MNIDKLDDQVVNPGLQVCVLATNVIVTTIFEMTELLTYYLLAGEQDGNSQILLDYEGLSDIMVDEIKRGVYGLHNVIKSQRLRSFSCSTKFNSSGPVYNPITKRHGYIYIYKPSCNNP